MVLGRLPFDEETSASMLRSFISIKKEGGMKQLTNAEVDELIALAKEKESLIPEEETQQNMMKIQENNRGRYQRKMIRKGYKYIHE